MTRLPIMNVGKSLIFLRIFPVEEIKDLVRVLFRVLTFALGVGALAKDYAVYVALVAINIMTAILFSF